MKKGVLFQLFLLMFLVIVSVFIYFKYFYENKGNKEVINKRNQTQIIDENLIENLKYFSVDDTGNIYEIVAKKGIIDRTNHDIILMENVEAMIELKSTEKVFIKSNNAKYNSKSYDTIFNGEVTVQFNEHSLRSDFLDLSFENNLVSIYDNVLYFSNISTLKADRAEIDILKKKTKIFMNDSKNKILIKSISNNGNN
ncbi:LPS export ABC transporter periplasmic protein LptC [Candidatus Pelagibacter communis]|uniref:LPS export ABC transporter periplasmic protein LptC n=1 Tax=Pelagibacter ubique TaxID=198252 RepID=UPI00094D96F0|nr:LPS export ABC transporter periplasmic protein LptC [Candidatus Pelagibacter ubique]